MAGHLYCFSNPTRLRLNSPSQPCPPAASASLCCEHRHTCTHSHTHIHTCTPMPTLTHTCTCKHVHTQTHTVTHTLQYLDGSVLCEVVRWGWEVGRALGGESGSLGSFSWTCLLAWTLLDFFSLLPGLRDVSRFAQPQPPPQPSPHHSGPALLKCESKSKAGGGREEGSQAERPVRVLITTSRQAWRGWGAGGCKHRPPAPKAL